MSIHTKFCAKCGVLLKHTKNNNVSHFNTVTGEPRYEVTVTCPNNNGDSRKYIYWPPGSWHTHEVYYVDAKGNGA